MAKETSISSDNIIRIAQGDSGAFRLLYYEYCHPLIKYAFFIVKDIELSEDIVQEVFYKVWDNKHKLNPKQNVKSYLYEITKNEALMALRKRSNRDKYRNEQDELLTASPEDIYLTKELNCQYNEILFSLPERCRVIFCMSRIEKMTYQEIADALSLSIKTIETQIGRALTIFRRKLSNYYPNYFKK